MGRVVIDSAMKVRAGSVKRLWVRFFKQAGPLLLTCSLLIPSVVNSTEGTQDANQGPLTLALCMEQAEKHSPALKSLPAELQAAELKKINADMASRPQLGIAVDYEIGDSALEENEYGELRPYISLTQEVLGRVDLQYEKKWAALNGKLNADVKNISTRRQLYFEVAQKYFNLLLSELKYNQIKMVMEQSRRGLLELRSKNRDGFVSEIEVLRAEVDVSRAEMQEAATLSELKQIRFEFATLLNQGPNVDTITLGPVESVTPYNVTFDEVKQFALQQNAELAIYQRVVDKLPEFKSLVDRINWPTISVSAFVGEAGSGGNSNLDSYGITVTVKKNIFDFGIQERKGQVMEIEMRSLESGFGDLRQKYFNDLELIFQRFQNSSYELELAKKSVELDRALLEKSKRSLELGQISQSEQLQQVDKFKESEYGFIMSTIKYRLAEISLKLTAGLMNVDLIAAHSPSWLNYGPQEGDGDLPTDEGN